LPKKFLPFVWREYGAFEKPPAKQAKLTEPLEDRNQT
jgi:hypothetical protein